MSNGSPTAYLLWAILACIFLVFLLLHLWSYDRFKCLKWDSGRQPGAFKRVMTYSYVATLPLLVVFSVAMTALKFKEGYWVTPDGEIVPRPMSLWDTRHRHRLLPLYFVLSVGWSLELVTHLEELAFWLFLLHQGPGKRDWFDSLEFRGWYMGSIIAIIGMPLTTLVKRGDIDTLQAWIFLAGASAGTFTTVCFLYVLARFPGFIQYVKDGGAEPDVVVRLATFYSLNRIRVVFRFLFTVPLLVIAVDALCPPYTIIGNEFAVDFLLMMGGIGCFISSAITLLIFFPRSITRESGYKAKIISPSNSAKPPAATSPLPDYYTRERGPSTPKAFVPASPTSGTRMSAFRYPNEPPTPHGYPVPHNADSQAGHPRRSTESETSPGYDSDAESIVMPASPSTVHNHAMAPRQNSSHTAMSRPTSGGKSDDTVWEHQDDFPSSARRRHSDGPLLHNRHGTAVATIPGSVPASEEGHRSSDREHSVTPSQLHPYVINFTSPIDLLDTPHDDRLPPHPPLQSV
ncbi:hypothetical protein GALMADRAFT_248075 [Galerina marginata CBS 339.88]|uniref:Transmembrane protein n=1 Tax=Galerina marginata (strain CBS 339.88) TaxID=685588 RepID=A0A067T9B3_GALM3|nr:hypothetical protein GALMADRAFT_248075 [Galerina marginata CBS 339.88]